MTAETSDLSDLAAGAPGEALLGASERAKLLLFGGGLLLLINFADPAAGLLNIPLSFFLKNRLHLQANQLAAFRLIVAIPLILSFAFGLLRDRWSPFRRGDPGHLLVFGLATALIYATVAFLPPNYAVLLIGVILATSTFQIVGSAAAGLISTIGQERAMAGQMSTLLNVAVSITIVAASLLGGVLSGMLEGQGALAAARALFLISAALMTGIAVFGVLRPKALFGARRLAEKSPHSFGHDFMRLLRHAPIYPVALIQVLWQFSPATGTVLQYHITNTLHASDAQWGAWNAIFYGSFIPMYLLYGRLCRTFTLEKLLWGGFILAVLQMAPLLFVHTAIGALIAAAPMGMIGGVAQGALTDLAIRSCPPRLQGTMMMLFSISVYWFAQRGGDLFGTEIYDHHGGFVPAVWITILVYALILPVILLVPKRLIRTRDGERLAAG